MIAVVSCRSNYLIAKRRCSGEEGEWKYEGGVGAKQSVVVLLNLYGFIYFKNALPTDNLGSSECVVCASCTVPIMGWLRKPGRNSGVCCLFCFVFFSCGNAHHHCLENSKPARTRRKMLGDI